MIHAPRFIKIDNKIHLMHVKLDQGKITDLALVNCVSNEGETKEQLIQGLMGLVQRAVHESDVINWEDLPQALRDKLTSSSNDNSEQSADSSDDEQQ